MLLSNFRSDIQKIFNKKIEIFDKRPFDYDTEPATILRQDLDDAYRKMVRKDKSFLLIDLNEYWECDIFSRAGDDTFKKLFDYLYFDLCRQNPTKFKRIILMTEDCNFEKLFSKWCKDNNLTNHRACNAIGFPNLFLERAQEYNRIDMGFEKENFFEIKKNRTPNKKFMCLMGIYSRHRDSLQKFYNDNSLWTENYISYIGNEKAKNPILLPDSGIMENLKNRNSTARTDNLGMFFDDSFFSVVPESNKWTVAPNSIFLTEKITKVLYHGHPFIVMGSKGYLQKLRDYGFETFPELFDESYDSIEDADERDKFIKKEILRVNSLSDEKLKKIYDSIYDKLLHNQKMLLQQNVLQDKFKKKLRWILAKEKLFYFNNYSNSFTKVSWNFIERNTEVYPDLYRFEKDISEQMYPDIFEETYQKMLDNNKKFICIIEDTEAHWFQDNLHKKIHWAIEQKNIPASKILMITNDYHAQKNYDKWCDGIDKTDKINIVTMQSYLYRMCKLVHESNKVEIRKVKKLEENRKYKFMMLLGKKTNARNHFWNWFEDNPKIKEQGAISYLHKKVLLEDSYVDVDSSKILDGWSNPKIDNLDDYFADSFFSVVPETESGVMMSEKIMKPLLYKHPFMTISQIGGGYIDLLKSYGFETFPEIFDESYDTKENPLERYELVQKEISRLSSESNNYLYEMYKMVEDKLDHNKKLVIDFMRIHEESVIKKIEEII